MIPVPKKDGGIRLCLDFRALNTTLKDDKFPMPNIQAILNQLGNSTIFTCLYMNQGYHKIPLDPGNIEKTAFSLPEGHWEFLSLPFGLAIAPSVFQRVVNSVLVGLIGTTTQVYLNDIIIQGRTFQEHVGNLQQVLDRLREANFILKLEKCEFFKKELSYLGHIIRSEGLKPQLSKVEAIRNMAKLQDVHGMQSFLGLMNYYRKFIPDFAKVNNPLVKIMGVRKGVSKKNDKTPL